MDALGVDVEDGLFRKDELVFAVFVESLFDPFDLLLRDIGDQQFDEVIIAEIRIIAIIDKIIVRMRIDESRTDTKPLYKRFP